MFTPIPPELLNQWHPTKNNNLDPKTISVGSGKNVWWVGDCGHEWLAKVYHRSNGSGCPICSGQKVLVGFNDLVTTHPELAKEWHPTLNGSLKPTMFTKGSGKKMWWLGECEHEFSSAITDRTNKNRSCPYCSGQKVLVGFNDLATTNPELASEWHPTKNDLLKPTMFTKGSGKGMWWLGECGHEWKTTIDARAKPNKGTGCPYCSGQKILVGFNDLPTTNANLISEWHPTRNSKLVTSVSSKSAYKSTWVCVDGHEWKAAVYNRTGSNQTGCPKCFPNTSKAEQEIFDYLVKQGLVVEQSNRISISPYELDIFLPEKNIAIEFNGLYWHSEYAGKGKTYHYNKWLECKKQGIQLIQVWEDDWSRNKDIILNGLKHKLGVSGQGRIFARKTAVMELSFQEAQKFLNENHIQGFASGSYYLGLVQQGDNPNLVAVLVLKKEAGTEGKTLNIIRYATSANVVGGFTKLLKHAERTYQPESFITFADHTISDGGLYKNNGFVADKELAPDYMYIVGRERKHKFGYRLKRFKNDPDLVWEEGLTERQLAKLNGIPRIWDAGKTRWVKEVSQ